MADLTRFVSVHRQKRMRLDPIGDVRSQRLSVIGRSAKVNTGKNTRIPNLGISR